MAVGSLLSGLIKQITEQTNIDILESNPNDEVASKEVDYRELYADFINEQLGRPIVTEEEVKRSRHVNRSDNGDILSTEEDAEEKAKNEFVVHLKKQKLNRIRYKDVIDVDITELEL